MNDHPTSPPDAPGDAREPQTRPLPPDWEEYEEEPVRRSRPRRERAVVLFTDEGGSLIRAGDTALDEDDLPVLTAFREFLEAERRRTRRQIRRLIALFIAGFALVAAGGTWLVRLWVLQLEARLETEKVQTLVRQAETTSNLQTVARTAVALKREVAESAQKSAAVEADLARQREEVARLLDSLRALEVENALLERAVRRMELVPPAPSSFPPSASMPPTPTSTLDTVTVERRPPEMSAAEPRPPPSQVSEAPLTQTTPAGIRFRLPLPKE